MALSDRVLASVRELFGEDDVAEAESVLRQVASGGNTRDKPLLWILALSEGSLTRLRYFADRAVSFPNDIAKLAHMPETDRGWPTRAGMWLQGGPVTVTERGPRRRTFGTDLWDRITATTLAPLVCPVCLEELDLRSGIQAIEVSRVVRTGGARFRHEMSSQVHPQCLDGARTMAHAQGYGWEELGDWPPGRDRPDGGHGGPGA